MSELIGILILSALCFGVGFYYGRSRAMIELHNLRYHLKTEKSFSQSLLVELGDLHTTFSANPVGVREPDLEAETPSLAVAGAGVLSQATPNKKKKLQP